MRRKIYEFAMTLKIDLLKIIFIELHIIKNINIMLSIIDSQLLF